MHSYSNIIKQQRVLVTHMDWIAVDPHRSEPVVEQSAAPVEISKDIKLREAMILERARLEAEKIRDEAVQFKEQARLEGFEEGYRAGLDQAAVEKNAALDLAERQMGDLLAAASNRLDSLSRDYEGHLLKLSVQVASVFIKSHMTPDQMMAPLKEMLHELSLSAKIIVRMSPEDFHTLSGSRDYFQEACPDSRLVMIEEAALSRGILQCETDSRMVEFDPGKHIEGLLAEMLKAHHRQQELTCL